MDTTIYLDASGSIAFRAFEAYFHNRLVDVGAEVDSRSISAVLRCCTRSG